MDNRSIEKKNILKAVFQVAVLFFIVLGQHQAMGSNDGLTDMEKQWLKDHPSLKVGVGVAFPPFMWIEKQAEKSVFKGIVSDYLNLLSDRLGVQMEIVYDIPFNKALEMGKNGQIDFFPCLSKTPERSEYLLFTQPYLAYPMVIITRENGPAIGDLTDLTGRRFAIVKHLVVYSKLENEYPHLNLSYVFTRTVGQNLEKVSLGQADACIINLAAASYYIQKKGLTNLKIAAPVNFEGVQLAMGIRKELAPLQDILKKTLAAIPQAEKDQISQRWVKMEYDLGVDIKKMWQWVLGTSAVIIVLFGLFFMWNRQLKDEISQRLQTQAELTASEQKLSALMGNLPGMVYQCLKDQKSTMLFLSRGCEALTGYLPEEILFNRQISYREIIHPQDRDMVDTSVSSAVKENQSFTIEYRIITKEKAIKWVREKGRPFEKNDQGIWILDGFIQDISDRKQAQMAQEKALNLLKNAEQIGRSGSWVLDVETGKEEWSYGEYLLHGISPDQAPSFELHMDCVYEQDREMHKRSLEEYLQSDHTFFTQEFRFLLPDGSFKHIHAQCHIERDPAGKPVKIWGTDKDVTDQKEAEAKIHQAQKMESIGNLAGGIAHEFNNILSIIMGNNELLMQDLSKKNWNLKNAEEIRIASMRARDVVKQLLTFSRQDQAIREIIDIRLVVKESVKLIRSSIPANIEINYTDTPGVYTVNGNGTQINQLLINLCANAADAVAEMNGCIQINLSNEKIEQEQLRHGLSLKTGLYVKLKVSDNGVGMDPQTLSRVFEPYFTTKTIGKGTGIGLAVVHGIVQRHDGVIVAQSVPGKGTDFIIWLPVEAKAVQTVSEDADPLPTGTGHILYIDDEPFLAQLGKRHLEDQGYSVDAFEDPLAALDLFKTDPAGFDLVITDMAMPRMTGDQLAEKLFDIRPDMPIIICTGYSETFSEQEALKRGIRGFLMKPVDKKQLVSTVCQILDQEG